MSKGKKPKKPLSPKVVTLIEQLQRQRGVRELEKRFLIVCEDGKSAPNYFEALKKHFQLSATSIQVVGSNGRTQPIQVVTQAVECVCRSRSAAPCRPKSAALGFRVTDIWGRRQRVPLLFAFWPLQFFLFTCTSFLGPLSLSFSPFGLFNSFSSPVPPFSDPSPSPFRLLASSILSLHLHLLSRTPLLFAFWPLQFFLFTCTSFLGPLFLSLSFSPFGLFNSFSSPAPPFSDPFSSPSPSPLRLLVSSILSLHLHLLSRTPLHLLPPSVIFLRLHLLSLIPGGDVPLSPGNFPLSSPASDSGASIGPRSLPQDAHGPAPPSNARRAGWSSRSRSSSRTPC